MRLTKKQKGALHWLASRSCKESMRIVDVLRNPKKTHSAQVKRHGLDRTLYSLKRNGLADYSPANGYYLTDDGRKMELALWEARSLPEVAR